MWQQHTGRKVFTCTSPCIKLLMSKLRDKSTSHIEFVSITKRLSTLLLETALGEEELITETRISATGAEYDHYLLKNPKICYISVLRAAEAMVNQCQQLTEDIAVGFVLIQRDEKTALPEYFYKKLPKDITERIVFIADPMLATGGSVCKCIELLVEVGVPAANIRFVNLISCQEGIDRINNEFPDVKVFTGVIDPILDASRYIIPGVGDFGDRYFGTV